MRKIRLLWSVCLAMLLASCTNPNKEESALKEPTDHGQKPAKGGEEPEDNGQKPVEEGKEPEDNGQQIESITVIDIRSERAKEYDAKIERARAGEAVDLDGDGHKEFRIWTDERGVRYVEGKGPPDNPYYSVSETRPDGSKISRHSARDDGIIDSEIQRKPGHEVQLYDRKRRGFFDERLTLITLETEMIHRIHEKRGSAEEAWTVIKDSVVPPVHGGPEVMELKNKIREIHPHLFPTPAFKKKNQ